MCYQQEKYIDNYFDVVQSTNHRRKGYFYCLNSVLLRAELWSIYIIIHKINTQQIYICALELSWLVCRSGWLDT